MAQRFIRFLLSGVICLSPAVAFSETQSAMYSVGVSKIDITPDYPIRLTGYASRQKESEGVAQRLYARALAFGSDYEKPAILVTVENCGVPAAIRDEVATGLREKRHIDPDRFALCSTHTHTSPWVEGFAPNIFGGPIPKDQAQRVKRYTRELTDALINVSLRALENRRPARLTRGVGKADFAANRRTKDGPVDHDLPALFVTGSDGKLRAIFLSYAVIARR